MGRSKTYNTNEIANKAMELFWMYGFDGTSTQALVEHMGVNRYSLYAEFGNKQGLYEAALKLYEKDVVSHHFAILETDSAGVQEIKTVIERFANASSDPLSKRGCFLCNSATERAAFNAATNQVVASYIDRICAAFVNALSQAQLKGEVRSDVNVKEEGSYLAVTLMGFFVLLRSSTGDSVIKSAAKSILRHVDAFQD